MGRMVEHAGRCERQQPLLHSYTRYAAPTERLYPSDIGRRCLYGKLTSARCTVASDRSTERGWTRHPQSVARYVRFGPALGRVSLGGVDKEDSQIA